MVEDAKIGIMVVDDTAHIPKILQFLLEKEGFDVIQAEDGEQALTLRRPTNRISSSRTL